MSRPPIPWEAVSVMPLIKAAVRAKPQLVVVPRTAALRAAPVVSRAHHTPAAISSTLAPRASAHSRPETPVVDPSDGERLSSMPARPAAVTAAAAHSRGWCGGPGTR
ncbi:hypothetical protein [Streptomyces sp. H62]